MNLADIEEKLKKVQLIKEMEHTFLALEASITNKGLISAIVAEDAAESERSVRLKFSAEESQVIFGAARDILKDRYEALKTEVGL